MQRKFNIYYVISYRQFDITAIAFTVTVPCNSLHDKLDYSVPRANIRYRNRPNRQSSLRSHRTVTTNQNIHVSEGINARDVDGRGLGRTWSTSACSCPAPVYFSGTKSLTTITMHHNIACHSSVVTENHAVTVLPLKRQCYIYAYYSTY